MCKKINKREILKFVSSDFPFNLYLLVQLNEKCRHTKNQHQSTQIAFIQQTFQTIQTYIDIPSRYPATKRPLVARTPI